MEETGAEHLHGVLAVDKPPGPSSARIVNQVKRLLPRKHKIGHAGTLDPFATGVLLLLLGRATRLCESLMDSPKQYEATIKLGASTATDDPESPEQPVHVPAPPSPDEIAGALSRFVGHIAQRPPAFSAMKVQGRRAYDLARGGQAVELAPRTVRVDAIDLLSYEWPLARVRIDCGRGTYIRAIARDLGEVLGIGGYLTQLRRTRVGEFSVSNAAALHELTVQNIGGYIRTMPPVTTGPPR